MNVTLVFGGGGFIGSALCNRLAACGEREVIAVGRSHAPKYALSKSVRYISSSLLSRDDFDVLLASSHEVVDLAYATVPTTSFSDPVNDVLENLPFSVNLLQRAARLKIGKFLLVSSGGTIYGEHGSAPICESAQKNPLSPYGITKLAIEKYASMFGRTDGLRYVIARPANPYGPSHKGGKAQGFVGAAIRAIRERDTVKVFGKRGTVRDYIFIDDLVRGLIAILFSGRLGEAYNVGTGVGFDNLEIIEKIRPLAVRDGHVINLEQLPERAFDVKCNILSVEKLMQHTGWAPKISLESGLAETWDHLDQHAL